MNEPFTVSIKDANGTYAATAKVAGQTFRATATAGAQQAAAAVAVKILGNQRFMAGHTTYMANDPRTHSTIEINPQ